MHGFWQIFVKAPEGFPTHIIQSKNSEGTYRYSEKRNEDYVMLLSNFGNDKCGLSDFSEKAFPLNLFSQLFTENFELCIKHDL